jgi:hypothetical protein
MNNSIKQLCIKCDLTWKETILENDFDQILRDNLCPECQLITKTYYSKRKLANVNKTNRRVSSLLKQSVYAHFNEDLLLNSKAKSTEKFINKNILIIDGSNVKRYPILNAFKQFPMNRLVFLSKYKSWAYDLVDNWIFADPYDIRNKEQTLRSVEEFMIKNNLQFDAVFTYDGINIFQFFYF